MILQTRDQMYVTPDAVKTRYLREYDCTNEYHQQLDPKRRSLARAQDRQEKPTGFHLNAALPLLRLTPFDQYASDETDDDTQRVYKKRKTVLECCSDLRERGFQVKANLWPNLQSEHVTIE